MAKTAPAVRILIADDHPIFRAGLRQVLESQKGFQVVGEAADGEQTIKLVGQLKPDILVLDMSMPRLTGMETLQRLSAASDPVRAIVLTVEIDPPQIIEALQMGAWGIVLKDSAAQFLVSSIQAAMVGQYWIGHEKVSDLMKAFRERFPQVLAGAQKKTFGLTPRELDIVAKIVVGYTNKDIAREFSISEDTINRLELALFALKHRLVGDL